MDQTKKEQNFQETTVKQDYTRYSKTRCESKDPPAADQRSTPDSVQFCKSPKGVGGWMGIGKGNTGYAKHSVLESEESLGHTAQECSILPAALRKGEKKVNHCSDHETTGFHTPEHSAPVTV
ncbi:hypothetical protein STEG23_022502, partial [Scotinomys teguina]